MAKPTEQQVKALELAHKLQFFDLVQANHLWIQLLKKVPIKNKAYDKNSVQWKSLANYGNVIANLVGKWYVRQRKFETRAAVPKVDALIVKYFLSPKNELKLYNQAKAWLIPNKKVSGENIGFIPLIIWGVILIIAAFTAYEITDELTTTAEEKQDLLKQTEKTCKDLNITGPQAAALISQTQQEASANEGGFFSGIMPKLAIGAFILYLISQNKKQSNG